MDRRQRSRSTAPLQPSTHVFAAPVRMATQEHLDTGSRLSLMTRYYFHAANGSQIRDEDGEDLSGLDAAKDVATAVMSELLAIGPARVWDDGALSVTVRDEAGRMVARLTTVATGDPAALSALEAEA